MVVFERSLVSKMDRRNWKSYLTFHTYSKRQNGVRSLCDLTNVFMRTVLGLRHRLRIWYARTCNLVWPPFLSSPPPIHTFLQTLSDPLNYSLRPKLLSRFGFSSYIDFAICTETQYKSRCIANTMHVEKPKRLIIWDEGSIF